MTRPQKSLKKIETIRPEDFYPNGQLRLVRDRPGYRRKPRVNTRAGLILKHERLVISMLRGPGSAALSKLGRDSRARGSLIALIKLTGEKPSIAMTRLGLTADEQARIGIDGLLEFMENSGFRVSFTVEGLTAMTPEGFNRELINSFEVQSLKIVETVSPAADWAINLTMTEPMSTLDMVELLGKVAAELRTEELL